MRWMRDIPWGIVALAVPVIGAIYAVYYLTAQPKQPSVAEKLRMAEQLRGIPEDAQSLEPQSAEESLGDEDTVRAPASVKVRARAKGGQCEAIEVAGNGVKGGGISAERWGAFMQSYHGAKADLTKWLESNRDRFTERQAAILDKQVRQLRVQRPPHAEEPDLHWRGIVAFTRDRDGEPLIRVGTGFLDLVEQQPTRARFEISRALAQAWSPCELERTDGGAGVWAPMLSCLGMEGEQDSCGSGTLGDSGWAISSMVASLASDPGCSLPAFQDQRTAACLKKFPFPQTEVAQR